MSQTITNAILAVEERLKQAMSSSNLEELDRLLSPDLVFTNHLGTVISKQDDLDLHASGDLEIEQIDLSDRRIMPFADVAIVTVKAVITGRYRGSAANGAFRFTRVWKKSPDANWQVVAGHASTID